MSNPLQEALALVTEKATRTPQLKAEYVQGYGHHVVLKSRDDLFDPATGDEIETDSGQKLPGLQLFTHNSITGIPDNVGCCEIVSVGSDVTAVKPGDVVFIDFFDVRQGVLLDSVNGGAERYIANDDAFKARFDPETGLIHPLPGFVVTRRNNERMDIALNGTDRVHAPPSMLTEGIIGSRNSDGAPATWVVYEEVVEVGPPAAENHTRPLHRVERELLDFLRSDYRGAAADLIQYDEVGLETALLIEQYVRWRNAPRQLDLKPGDLVPFCTYLAVQVRVRGEFLRIVKQSDILGCIDDRKMLEDAVRAGKAGKLQLVESPIATSSAGFGATLAAAQRRT